MDGVASARNEPLAKHHLAHRITHDWEQAVRGALSDGSYKVQGSPGKGNWAETVWLAVFDRMITKTAQRGFYVVYLVVKDGSRTYLSLKQGTTEILDRVGRATYRKSLENTATRDIGLLASENTDGLLTGPIDLDGSAPLTRGYEAGNIAAILYERGRVPPETKVEADLQRLLGLYQALAEARDQVQADESDVDDPDQPARTGIEARRYRWHRRAERNRSLASDAKRIHGTRCQVKACGKELGTVLGSSVTGTSRPIT